MNVRFFFTEMYEKLHIMEMYMWGFYMFLSPSAPSPTRQFPSKNECKEILLGCLVMYFL